MSDEISTNPGNFSGGDGREPMVEHTTEVMHRAPSGGALEARFPNPGLPEHRYRITDTDPRAARRAERQVASLFGLSVLGTLTFIVGYLAVQLKGPADVALSTRLLGGGLFVALFSIGAAAIHWAKVLMSDEEVVEERHGVAATEEQRATAAEMWKQGVEESGFGRRKLIRNSMLTALGALLLPAVLALRDLGPLPRNKLAHTAWAKGKRIVTDPTGNPIKPEDIPIGGVVHVLPEGILDDENALEEKAKAAVLLIRLSPEDAQRYVAPGRENWDYQGIVAYSKICTHVGCPVGLYEQVTHHLLCPCHQSTFDVLRHCKVIFGPAARPLPQLAITVDADGYLVAQHDFVEPVGPSFWERG